MRPPPLRKRRDLVRVVVGGYSFFVIVVPSHVKVNVKSVMDVGRAFKKKTAPKTLILRVQKPELLHMLDGGPRNALAKAAPLNTQILSKRKRVRITFQPFLGRLRLCFFTFIFAFS